jgi:glyoxylase-like metal-dependent hydrolase (beta-lactamase superfamily II)
MDNISWNVGAVKISPVIEVDAGKVIQEIIPAIDSHSLGKVPWLTPSFCDDTGHPKAVVQSFVISVGGLRIVVDPGIGNRKTRHEMTEWSGLETDFLDRISALVGHPNAVDMVLCTHLHFDHVGWNTTLVDGNWQPTFPAAQYHFCRDEFDYWAGRPSAEIEDDHAGFVDSILPVVNAGLANFVSSEAAITGEISLIPTPGHSPFHASVLIESEGERAVITGDAIHHPCQIAYPDWGTTSDTNKELARRSRISLLDRFSDSQTLFIGSHFPPPTAGYVSRDGNGFRFSSYA